MAIHRIILDVEMLDGTQYLEVKTCLADQAAYAHTRRVHKWDSPAEDPLTFLNFLAYAALKREKKLEGSYDDFVNNCAAVGDSGEDEEVNPT